MTSIIKYFKAFPLILITFLQFNSYSQNDYLIKKYSQLVFRESPYATYKGAISLSMEKAKTMRHYAFKYDTNNQLIEIQHKLGDLPYTAYGMEQNLMFPCSKVKFEKLANEIHVSFFDHNNLRIEVNGGIYTAKYKLQDDASPKTLTFYDKQGKIKENNHGISNYEWLTNDSVVIEKRYNLEKELMPLRPNFLFFETHLTYDKSGYVKRMDNYGKNGVLENNESGVATDEIFYNEDGIFVGWKVYDSNGNKVTGNLPNVHHGKNIVDGYGNTIIDEYFNTEGKQMMNYQGLAKTINSFDAFSNVIEQKRFTIDGWNQSAPIFKLLYDQSQRLKEIGAFDIKGKRTTFPQQEVAFFRMQYYNESGYLKEQAFYDKNEQLLNIAALGGGARVIHNYKGAKRIRSKIYDAKGVLLQTVER
ncbi:hypothetical protein [uncultured Croceitalea sp.]|uniref:hypothetical protein n=1 Tax=uncultured Croceitalea sp. TaxID=1798908 RepID=UPI0033064FC1